MVGADANAAAKYDDKGIAPIAASANGVAKDTSSLPSKVNVYEITDKGLAARRWSMAINTGRMTY